MQTDDAMHLWYDEHAHEFADAAVIESLFVRMPRDAQERLNRFKLWALDHSDVKLNGKHVLEFGAGHGRLAFAYPGLGSYLGVDSSQNLVALGNRRLQHAGIANRAQLVHGEVMSFAEHRQFDVVCSLGMMCYFADPAPVIEVMARFVKPGGWLFFDFRNDSWLYSGARRIKWLLHPPTGGVAYVARPRSIDQALRRLGFQDVSFTSREFPWLAEHYAKSGSAWPLQLRNAFARSSLARPLATEAWVFARRP